MKQQITSKFTSLGGLGGLNRLMCLKARTPRTVLGIEALRKCWLGKYFVPTVQGNWETNNEEKMSHLPGAYVVRGGTTNMHK